ncbi:MAG: hypothetical protein ABEL04_06630 [Salinibacter sp.]|uniref:hypothetical protein n=1 Tax=Salinibacter sp. TaxID=2065818 RepID=UPI0035D3D8E2
MSLVSSLPSCRKFVCGCILGTLLWGAVLPAARAQQTRTLDIQNGTVYVNGRPLSDDQLPDSLNLKGVNAHYRFLGIQHPVVDINGRLFAVKNGLTPVTEEEVQDKHASVILRDETARVSSQKASSQGAPSRSTAAHRQYLDAVQKSSRTLYKRLMRERQMEEDARELARTIRLLPEGPERQARIDTLRALLGKIFELKQKNRRREIERLQRQIQELENSIRKRERMRQLMIDRRLRQLTDSTQGR